MSMKDTSLWLKDKIAQSQERLKLIQIKTRMQECCELYQI